MDLQEREDRILVEIISGNIPSFLRTPVAISFSEMIGDREYNIRLSVMPDYLAVGSDSDHFLMPMTPILAQKVMHRIGGSLPTRKLVDKIWSQATLKLEPAPIPPSAEMVTVPVFEQHMKLVAAQRSAELANHPLNELVAGHKKDVILSNQITSESSKVIIYGWHMLSGSPIQPLYSGHVNWYADYSHGIRVLMSTCVINDSLMHISDVLQDPTLYQLLSDESGLMLRTAYDTLSSNYP